MDKDKVHLSTKIEMAHIDDGWVYRNIIRLSGEVNREELTEALNSRSDKAKEEGLRPGQINRRCIISADKMACLWSLIPDGNIPMDFPEETIVFAAQLPPITVEEFSGKDYISSRFFPDLLIKKII
jgi:hypothetical protein